MKRGKIFSILTSAAMVFSLSTPLNVFAEETGLPEPVNGVITLTNDVEIDKYDISKGTSLTLDLSGHKLEVTQDVGLKVEGELVINDSSNNKGIIDCKQTPLKVNEGKLTINGGNIISHDDYGIYVLNNGKVIVNGGTVTSKEASLTGNNTKGNMNFEVNGGTLTAQQGPAIYMPGQGSLKISGGTLNGGVSLRMGQVDITGGTINSISSGIDSPSEYYNYSGNVWLPDAIYVFGGTYTSEDSTYSNSLNMNITGGTINCKNDQGSAVAIYDLGKEQQDMNINISGSSYLETQLSTRNAYDVLTLSDIGVSNPKEGFDKFTGKVNTSITGGTFSSDVTQYLNKTTDTTNILKYKAYKVDGKYQVAACAYDFDPSDTEGLVNGTLRIEEGKERTIKVLVKPYTSLNKPVFTSENEKVAKVDASGKVTAVSTGTTKINIVVGDLDSYINISVYKHEEPEKVPTIDTTKPVEEVKVGVNDESVNETLKETTNEIISAVNDSIDNPKDAATTAINEKTKENLNKAIADGKSISTKVKVEEIKENTLDKETQEKVEKEIEKLSTGNKTDAIVCQYLDLSVALLADGEEIGNVNELNKEVEFKIAIPKDLLKEGRKFYVVRVHNGEVEVLETTLNEDGTLSFKTNKFSTYAVVYEDAKEPAKDPSSTNPSVTPVTVPSAKAPEVKSKAKKEESKKVKTGDESKTMLYVELGLMAIAGCAIIFLQSKKTKALNK